MTTNTDSRGTLIRILILTLFGALCAPLITLAAPPPPAPVPMAPSTAAAPQAAEDTRVAIASLPGLATPEPAALTAFTQATAAGGDRSFAVGTEVVTTANLNVRTYPSLTSSVVRVTMPRGSLATVRTSFIEADGYHWQFVTFSTGERGWVAVEFVTDDAATAEQQAPASVPPVVDDVPPVPPVASATGAAPSLSSLPIHAPAAFPSDPVLAPADAGDEVVRGASVAVPPVLEVATPSVPRSEVG